MVGKRDSEIAMIIQVRRSRYPIQRRRKISTCTFLQKFSKDNSFEDSLMDGKPYKAGKFALSLRKHLFREHLGLLKPSECSDINVEDPVADSFYKDTWIRVAALNTKIYEEVFRCIPCKLFH